MKKFADITSMPSMQQGKAGYILLWLLGVPIPILFLIFLLRGPLLSPGVGSRRREDHRGGGNAAPDSLQIARARAPIMTTFSAINGDERMKRAILVALGIGVVVTSATAFDVTGKGPSGTTAAMPDDPVHIARTRDSARADQRARIDERYLADRGICSGFSGFRRDKCLVQAHATRGRAMLEAAAPYEVRF